MKKLYTYSKIICISILFLVTMGSYSYADSYLDKELSQKDFIKQRVSTANKTMNEDKVDFETKFILMEKISKGELLDSEKNNVKPVKIQNYTEDSYKVTKEIFSDKSYILTKITDIEPIIEKNAGKQSWTAHLVRGTIIDSTSQHTTIVGAKVVKSYGAFNASFKFDYVTSRTTSQIDRVYGQRGVAGGGTMSLSTPRIVKRTDAGGSPARAEMGFNFSGYGGVGSYSGVAGVTVRRSGASPY